VLRMVDGEMETFPLESPLVVVESGRSTTATMLRECMTSALVVESTIVMGDVAVGVCEVVSAFLGGADRPRMLEM